MSTTSRSKAVQLLTVGCVSNEGHPGAPSLHEGVVNKSELLPEVAKCSARSSWLWPLECHRQAFTSSSRSKSYKSTAAVSRVAASSARRMKSCSDALQGWGSRSTSDCEPSPAPRRRDAQPPTRCEPGTARGPVTVFGCVRRPAVIRLALAMDPTACNKRFRNLSMCRFIDDLRCYTGMNPRSDAKAAGALRSSAHSVHWRALVRLGGTAAIVALAVATPLPGTAAVVLENAELRVALDPVTGGFASIYDKRSGTEYVAAPDRALLLRLIVPDGDFVGGHLDAAAPTISVEQQTARIVYDLKRVRAVATLRLEGSAVLATLSVTNGGSRAIEETIFPWVRGLGPMSNACLIAPAMFARKTTDPLGAGLDRDHHTWNEGGQKRVYRYPAHLASAWVDYGNAEQGIAIEGRHTDFSIMDFFIHKVVEKTRDPVRRTLDLATVQPRRIAPGEIWTSAPVRIAVHQGDWHAAADAHREWLSTWIGKPKRPAKFAQSIGWHFYFMKHQDGWVVNTYDDLPKMAEASLAAGCPYLLVFGWQTGGHDNNYLYRYVPNDTWGGVESLRKALDKVRQMGVEVIPFFNGTLANIEMPEHKEFGIAWEAMTRAGHPYYAGNWARQNFDAPTRNRDMLHHEICPCDSYRPYFLNTARRIVQDYGFGNLQLDQISEKMFPCYNELHHHAHPDRAYVDGLLDLLPKTQAAIRKANPDGVAVGELINDFTAQWLDGSWSWRQTDFPAPVLYTLPWVMMSHEIDALEYDEVNKAFAYKFFLDMKIDGGDSPVTKYPAFASHIKGLADLRRRVLDYYVSAEFRDEDGIKITQAGKVLAKVFRNAAARKTGIVLTEVGGVKDGGYPPVAMEVAGRPHPSRVQLG